VFKLFHGQTKSMANAVANNCRKIGGKGGILPANKANDKPKEKAAQTKGMKSETNGSVNAAN